ncbi:MAG: right-handed parallel beta-helix repeat-containing protein, partial [Verrucomicrobiota bacterium]|nr:right-handed parallel beta-helix repeat-containing protein [Verrucomicrobiota bacterium]
MKKVVLLLLLNTGLLAQSNARIFYLDSRKGNDSNDGKTERTAWKSLAKANAAEFDAGDHLRLKRGSRFKGGLKLKLNGTAGQPIVIEVYGEGRAPVIDAKGYFAGVHLQNSHHVVVKDLEITADGGKTMDGSKPSLRYGVLVQGKYGRSSHVTLENLTIYKIYPEVGAEHEGHNPTTYLGTAISIEGSRDKPCTDFLVQDCRIAQTGFKAINLKNIQQVQVLNNRMKDIGGPAIQPGNVDDLVVRGNIVDGSGSSLDPRMHARGSGIWPWTSNRVLIEKNKFMHARGKGDSCGIHIDFNCRDVIVQYNLSIDNEGGFVEILGNNHNCAYRYNISINDGFREKGKNKAFQEGKILWTSGYVGSKKPRHGPYNSYIYNNTIHVGKNSRSCFSFGPSTEGLLVANNIFHIMGKTVDVLGDQNSRQNKNAGEAVRVRVENNIYFHGSILPASLPFKDSSMIVGDPRFKKAGGLEAKHYVPGNVALVQDKGIAIPRLDGDEIGLRI